jgi:hypothetical protein
MIQVRSEIKKAFVCIPGIWPQYLEFVGYPEETQPQVLQPLYISFEKIIHGIFEPPNKAKWNRFKPKFWIQSYDNAFMSYEWNVITKKKPTRFSAPGKLPRLARLTASSRLFS